MVSVPKPMNDPSHTTHPVIDQPLHIPRVQHPPPHWQHSTDYLALATEIHAYWQQEGKSLKSTTDSLRDCILAIHQLRQWSQNRTTTLDDREEIVTHWLELERRILFNFQTLNRIGDGLSTLADTCFLVTTHKEELGPHLLREVERIERIALDHVQSRADKAKGFREAILALHASQEARHPLPDDE